MSKVPLKVPRQDLSILHNVVWCDMCGAWYVMASQEFDIYRLYKMAAECDHRDQIKINCMKEEVVRDGNI